MSISGGQNNKGVVVIASTATSVQTFDSWRECARVYGISRPKLLRLILKGGTADDGRTTFDVPCNLEEDE